MLWNVLREVEVAQGPLTFGELSRRLNIEPGVLEAMIQFWVRKGRLIDHKAVLDATRFARSTHHCSRHCLMAQACPHSPQLPRMIALKPREIKAGG